MNHPDDSIQIKYVNPESAGWVRVAGKSRTWERPNGVIHIFPPEEQELLMLVENPLQRFRRLAIEEFKKWVDEQEGK